MADRKYTVRVIESGTNVTVQVLRDSTTQPVDAAAGAGKRLVLPWVMDQSGSGAGTDGQHPVGTITAATDATPIVLTTTETMAALGIADNDMVTVEGALGNTSANGTFIASSTSGSNTTLLGSAGNAAWTSGGKIFKVNPAKGLGRALTAATAAILNDKATNG